MAEAWTKRTLMIGKVSDELFWHMCRVNNASMEYGGDDAYIVSLKLPKNFTDALPVHLRSEYKWIVRKVRHSKARWLEIRPQTLSDRWDEAFKADSVQEFLEAVESGKHLFEKRYRSTTVQP